jgi:hypothetical protein
MSQPQIGTTNQIFHPKTFTAAPSAYKLFITESRNSRCAFSKFFNLSHPDAPRELARGIVWKWPVASGQRSEISDQLVAISDEQSTTY